MFIGGTIEKRALIFCTGECGRVGSFIVYNDTIKKTFVNKRRLLNFGLYVHA